MGVQQLRQRAVLNAVQDATTSLRANYNKEKEEEEENVSQETTQLVRRVLSGQLRDSSCREPRA